MLAPALRRHGGDGAFHDLQKRLLHPLARNVSGDGGVVGLAGDLVDLVDIDDAALRAFDVVFGGLQQLENDVLHILADVTGFGQCRRIGHRERHIEDPRQSLRQQCLAAPRRADQHDVGFRQFDIRFVGVIQALVVIVNGDREDPLGVGLTDHVVVQHAADLQRSRHAVVALQPGALGLFPDDVHAQFDAFIADEHRGARNQLAHLVLAFPTERAIKRVLGIVAGITCHIIHLTRALTRREGRKHQSYYRIFTKPRTGMPRSQSQIPKTFRGAPLRGSPRTRSGLSQRLRRAFRRSRRRGPIRGPLPGSSMCHGPRHAGSCRSLAQYA
mmetsp:Transcript_1279/g.2539  ORF Transcript_1279/g.2539 Transcript_1279/m.2539 type:complete len:328 (+) Transcript_1279:930-1913(+)